MDVQFPAVLDSLRKKSKESQLLSHIRRQIPDRTRKQTQIDPNEYFPPLPDLPVTVPEENTRAESEAETSKLDKSNRSAKNKSINKSKQQQQQELEVVNEIETSLVNKKSKSTKKNKIEDNVYHFVKDQVENIETVVEEFKENRKSHQSRKSLAKRKLDYQKGDSDNDEEEEEAEVPTKSNNKKATLIQENNTNTPPPTQTTVLSVASNSKLNINNNNNNNKTQQEEAQLMPPPPPAVAVAVKPTKSNSDIVISKFNPDYLADKRKSLTINFLNTLSPIASMGETNKSIRNRQVHEIRQLQSQQILNDDSKDETELIMSQTQKFLRKSTLKQNNTTQSTTSRLSIGSTPTEATMSNPFQSRTTPIESAEIENGGKKKRKRSPSTTLKDKNETPLASSTQIKAPSTKKNKNKNKKKNKKINNSYESDEDNGESSETDEELKTSPNKKPNNKRNSAAAAVLLVEENNVEEPAPSTNSIFKSKSKIPVSKSVIKTKEKEVVEEPKTRSKNKKDKNTTITATTTPVSIPASVVEETEDEVVDNAPEPMPDHELDIIPETQEEPTPVDEIVTATQSQKSTKGKGSKTAKKSTASTKTRSEKYKEKKQPIIHPIEEEPDVESDGIRRSSRTKIQAHANLKPIYSLEYFTDASGRKIPMRKITGYEKIDNDLVRFREKFMREINTKKTKTNKKKKTIENEVDEEEEEERQQEPKTKTTTNKKPIKRLKNKNQQQNLSRIQRPESDDEDEDEDDVEPVVQQAKKQKSNNKKNGKKDASVDQISIVIETEEPPLDPIADINNNSHGHDFNTRQPRLIDELLSQSYYQHIEKAHTNVEQEVVPLDNSVNETRHCFLFGSKRLDRDYSEISPGVLAAAIDDIRGLVCIEPNNSTVSNEHDTYITYVIQGGYVDVEMKGVKTTLKPTDLVTIPHSCKYVIHNPSASKRSYLSFVFGTNIA